MIIPIKLYLYSRTGSEELWKIQALQKALKLSHISIMGIICGNSSGVKLPFTFRRFASVKHSQLTNVAASFPAVDLLTLDAMPKGDGVFLFLFDYLLKGEDVFSEANVLGFSFLENNEPRSVLNLYFKNQKYLTVGFLNNRNIIYKANYRIYRHNFKKTFSEIYSDCSGWLEKLNNFNIIESNTNEKINKLVKKNAEVTIIKEILFVTRLILNNIRQWYKLFFVKEVWNVGIIKKPITEFGQVDFLKNIQWLPEPVNGFNADPFGLETKGGLFVLYEKLFFNKPIGNISSVLVDSKNTIGKELVFLESETHLSYPFVFEDGGKSWIIPENCESCELNSFQFNEDSQKPESKNLLISETKIVDPTIIKYNNLYWLFCTIKDDLPDLKLHIYYSETINGKWEKHKNNPVKTDISSARPGGTPFLLNGKLIRPGQDSSYSYGDRIVLNEIIKLSPHEYLEQQIGFIDPPKFSRYNCGLHTFSSAGNYTLIDAKRKTFKFNKKLLAKLLKV